MTAIVERPQVWWANNSVVERDAGPTSPAPRQEARARFPARPVAANWPATRRDHGQVLSRLTRAPFILPGSSSQLQRVKGLSMLLDGLQQHPGGTWQQRWLASGAEAAGASWRRVFFPQTSTYDDQPEWRKSALSSALVAMVCADTLRPSLSWLLAGTTGPGIVVRNLARSRDVAGFARLRTLCDNDPDVSTAGASHILYRSALIIAAKGGMLADITVGDVLELLDVEASLHSKATGHAAVFYRMLHRLVSFGHPAPATLRELGPTGQQTPAELIDRYHLRCRPIRDLLVDYLRERQPALDYVSLKSLAHALGKRFWADIEHHHPGIDTLRLPVEITDAWKQRLKTKTKTVTTAGLRQSRVIMAGCCGDTPRLAFSRSGW